MDGPTKDADERLLDGIARDAASGGGRDAAAIRRFAGSFLAQVPPQDLADADGAALAEAISSLWSFASGREPGRPKLRAFGPSSRHHPWKTGGTVIEIVNDDMPFVVDSLTAALDRHGLTVHLAVHPVVRLTQGPAGWTRDVAGLDAGGGGRNESIMHFRVTEQTDRAALRETMAGLRRVLQDVRSAVRDWRMMREQVTAAIAELDLDSGGFARADVREAVAFLKWLDNRNFTFLGHREYAIEGRGRKRAAKPVAGSGFGILRDPSVPVFEDFGDTALPPDALAGSSRLPPVLVYKGDRRSRVHRNVYPDTILIRKADRSGKTTGYRLLVGLFTSLAYRQPITAIPIIRRKIRNIATGWETSLDSHDGRVIANIMETLPRDELFQYGEDELARTVREILRLRGRKRVALFTRRDPFGRYVSCLVYLPRERFETRMRRRVEAVLTAGFGGDVASQTVEISDDLLARMHIVIRIRPGQPFAKTVDAIGAEVAEACRVWTDDLAAELAREHGETAGARLFARFRNAFPASWQDRYSAASTVADIARIDSVIATGNLALDLLQLPQCPPRCVQFRVFIRDAALPLSDALPVLENMGFRIVDENPQKVVTDTGEIVWMHDFGMVTRDGAAVDLEAVREPFAQAFVRIRRNEVEDDGFNALVLSAGLGWRQVVAVRALCRYLRQARIPFSETYMMETLVRHSATVGALVALFEATFAPGVAARTRRRRVGALQGRVREALDAVDHPDEDRILRRLFNLIDSTLRTNFFLPGDLPYLSFKFDSARIVDLPLPRPMREIFVYSPRVEGVHCRGGPVARGGLRWSDRREDFRTEILGLMKAQMTKNAVIVPEGAKGGFVVKRPPQEGGREALVAEGVACYRTFVRGLLDITDNLVSGRVAPPEHVVRRDGDDPYLVVAADKGTATFSDIANGIAAEYGFWLGDAFASGGSAGYDHKKMGITARGAWECVKRHFREIGTDIQREDFTVVGIGDMSGDVFGNGMLRSRHIRLVGAFNHMHVFVDPDPDAAASWKERNRLFRKARSAWSDYNRKLISKGGGVFERRAKEIRLAPEARRLFGLPDGGAVTPDELIRAMLGSEVDLLWFGGIGTYVKASDESDAEADDRANDPVRVNGRDLRCKVVGEGANLGVTQRGRIEYGLRGGRVNADFIDNSAGVASSDQEVNIKILLGEAVAAGRLGAGERDGLLADMTDDVARFAMRDNYRQGMALSHAEAQAPGAIGEHGRLIRALERSGELDRAVERLPDDEGLAERAARGHGLTRPEIAVLLAYAKTTLQKTLLDSDVPDDPWLVRDIGLYFPPVLRERYADLMTGHRLRREIVATYVANSLINRVGPTFVDSIAAGKGISPDRIVRAYLICREVFGLPGLWNRIEALDNKAAAAAQTALHLAVIGLVRRATVWFATRGEGTLDVSAVAAAFRPGVALLSEKLRGYMSADRRERTEEEARRYARDGVPAALARDVAELDTLYSGCDVVRVAGQTGEPVGAVAGAYFLVGRQFGFDALRDLGDAIVAENDWQATALESVRDELHDRQAALTRILIGAAGRASAVGAALGEWEEGRSGRVARLRQVLADIGRSGGADLAMLSVASGHLRELCEP